MAYSEKGFGARIANAQDLLTHLTSFNGYAPPAADLDIAALQALIDTIKTQNDLTTGAIDEYAMAVDNREKLFKKEKDSLAKLVSPIDAATIAAFGKEAKQTKSVQSLTNKIKGKKLKKLGKDPDAAAISESERSYGSMAQTLADIIVIFDRHSSVYTPSNPGITVPALQTLYTKMVEGAKVVATTLGFQKTCRSERTANYQRLHNITQRIKAAVKSQYTASSTEYKLIKSLTI